MNHKDICINYVEARKFEEEDGWWWIEPHSGDHIEGPFPSEEKLDDVLWPYALDHAHENLIP